MDPRTAFLKKASQFISSDLHCALEKCGANFLVALALVSYTQFFGYLRTKNHIQPRKGDSKRAFEDFLKLMGPFYYTNTLSREPSLYDKLRNGLVHNYTAKMPGEIKNASGSNGLVIKRGFLTFYLPTYLEEFERALSKYIAQIQTERILQTNFDIARQGLPALG